MNEQPGIILLSDPVHPELISIEVPSAVGLVSIDNPPTPDKVLMNASEPAIVQLLQSRPSVPGETITILSTTAIDLAAVAETNLFTAVTSTIILGFVLRVTFASNVTLGPTFGIGAAAGASDFFASRAMKSLTTQGRMWISHAEGGLPLLTAGQILKAGVDVAATGSSPVITAAVDLIGYTI